MTGVHIPKLEEQILLSDLQKPYILISEILKKQKRDIILNLCQYGMGDVWKWGKAGWRPELANSR